MQTTLLGLAIALILALVTALVGPYFVNWNDHRAFFETEASRLVGLNVRVAGPIKVSMLPAPSMTLGDIEIGPAGQTSRLRARQLSIELALGALMKGEIRAVETRLVGPQFGIGLNSLGRIDWPSMAPQPEAVAIERLNIEDGRVVFTDAVSNTRLVLDKLWFRGQVRSLAGPFRGEGAFVSGGEIFGYRLSTGRLIDDGLKVKLNVDIAERPLAIEVDGLLASDGSAPRFDGSLSLSRPVVAVKSSGRAVAHEPWKLTGKVKANAEAAVIEQIEFQYGPEERAAKLDGAAEFKFGERPRLQAAMSARQIDLDRLIATPASPRRLPAAATQAVAELFGAALRPPVPVSLTVSVDAVTVGGSVVQGFGSDVRLDGNAWRVDRLDFRAPGFTRVGFSGEVDPATKGFGFAGNVSIDANDPRALVGWLAGQPVAPGQAMVKPWSFRGDVKLGANSVVIEQLKSEFDRGAIEGRLAYSWPAAGRPAQLDADLRAAEIDFDAMLAFADGAFAGVSIEPPRDVTLALDIGKARIAGFEARNNTARVKFDTRGVQIERLSVGDFGNATIDASGRIQTAPSPGGSIALDLDARELNAVLALADRFAPQLGDPLRRMAGRDRTAKLRASVSLENAAGGSAAAKLAVTGRVGATRLDVNANATGKPEHFVVTDLGALIATDGRFEGRFEADDGAHILAMIGLDRFADASRRATGQGQRQAPARLTINTTGSLQRELRFDGRLAVGNVDAGGKGTLRLGAKEPTALNLEQVSGTIGGSKVQGRLALRFGDAPRLDGALETDTLDAPAIVAAAIGMRTGAGQAWTTDPFAVSGSDLAGRIEFKSANATLTDKLRASAVRGSVRLGPSDIVFDEVEGELAGGRLGARLAFVTGPDGLSSRARITLSGAEAASIIGGDPKRPALAGKLTFQTELEGTGRSPAAFVGSIAGTGSIVLENAQFAGLNPRVFDAVIRAVDLGIPSDTGRIRDFVTTSLENGSLPAARAEAPFTVTAGQVRIGRVVTRASGADLTVSANVDLADGLIDAVVTMTGTQHQVAGERPAIVIGLKGPLLSPSRTVDANALASWIALRSVEQQSKQIDSMEREREKERERERQQREANTPPAEAPAPATTESVPSAAMEATGGLPSGNGNMAPPLPPAINVVPAPRPRAVPRAEGQPPVRAAAPKTSAPSASPVGPPLDLLGAQH